MLQKTETTCPRCHHQALRGAAQPFCAKCSFPLMHVAGKYRLERLINEGGFGLIYLARHTGLSHAPLRVIKILKDAHQQQEGTLERFKQEVQLTAELSEKNDHIVRIFDDFGYEPHLGFYYVMEYLEGEDLLSYMRKQKSVEMGVFFSIAEQLCKALHAAHQRGVIHRDLKPENVFLTQREGYSVFVKLLDFGIARSVQSSVKRTRGALGTPEYMSPEQCMGMAVSVQSDVYSAGVLLYEVLAGRLPFEVEGERDDAALMALLQAHINNPPVSLRSLNTPHTIPAGLDQALLRALAKKPHERYDSMAGFWEALSPYAPTSTTSQKRSTKMTKEHLFAVEVAPSSYWVGSRPEKTIFFANPYLRIFRGKNKEGRDVQFNLLIDPGSSQDFATVQAKVSSLIGGMDKISAVFINHQDPDVASSTTLLLGRYSPRASIICSEDTWRLVQHFNLPRERFISTDKYPRGFSLETGHLLLPVPSPFCHFAGAVMLYDPETRVLYSGDLFGGLTDRNATGLVADESDWVGMRAFHQIYMPMNKALKRTIQVIRNLTPTVEMIAPQHGRVIKGEMLASFMQRLEKLPVGLDLVEDTDNESPEAWNTVLGRVLKTASQLHGQDLRPVLQEAEELKDALRWTKGQFAIARSGRWVVERAVILLTTGLPPWIADPIKMEALVAAEELQLSSPNVDISEGERQGASAGMS